MAATPRPERIKQRRDFLRVAGLRRKWAMPGLVLQVRPRPEAGELRYGITASRKVGNAVARNRAKRRLRVLADDYLPRWALDDHDYVLIARPAAVRRPFELLISDLKTALTRLKVTRAAAPGDGERRPISQDPSPPASPTANEDNP